MKQFYFDSDQWDTVKDALEAMADLYHEDGLHTDEEYVREILDYAREFKSGVTITGN
jgi:mannitol/fructose-specific phosphotransferase system IIA component (Ntr-type)